MRYVQLRAFHNVAIHGGFSRAAEALFLTQPAISDQVRKLEDEYDILLFNRQKKQVTVTQEGEKLLEVTKRLFEAEKQASELLSKSRAFSSGTLRIKADSTQHIIETITKFRAKYPRIRIEISSGNTEAVMRDLYAYKADIGVLGTVPKSSDITAISLGSSQIVAFTAKSNPLAHHASLTLQALAEQPLVMREPGSKTRQKLDAEARQQGLKLPPAIEAEGRMAVQEIVSSGTGIGFVSEIELMPDERLTKIRIKGPPILMDESVVSLRERRGGKLIQAFNAMVRESTNAAVSN